MPSRRLSVTLYSDFTCPYCYLVERGSLPRLAGAFQLDVKWVPFEVEPDAPSMPLVRAWYEDFTETAHHFGLKSYRVPVWLPNTNRLMALAEFARDAGKLEAFRERAMKSYWEEERSLDGDDELAELATSAGLDATAALDALEALAPRVLKIRQDARRAGVGGVPRVDFGAEQIVGAQPDEVFTAAAHRARR